MAPNLTKESQRFSGGQGISPHGIESRRPLSEASQVRVLEGEARNSLDDLGKRAQRFAKYRVALFIGHLCVSVTTSICLSQRKRFEHRSDGKNPGI